MQDAIYMYLEALNMLSHIHLLHEYDISLHLFKMHYLLNVFSLALMSLLWSINTIVNLDQISNLPLQFGVQ